MSTATRTATDGPSSPSPASPTAAPPCSFVRRSPRRAPARPEARARASATSAAPLPISSTRPSRATRRWRPPIRSPSTGCRRSTWTPTGSTSCFTARTATRRGSGARTTRAATRGPSTSPTCPVTRGSRLHGLLLGRAHAQHHRFPGPAGPPHRDPHRERLHRARLPRAGGARLRGLHGLALLAW